MILEGRHRVPRIDDTVTLRNVHERAERVAVPDFDWLVEPVEAIVEGFIDTFGRHVHRRQADDSHDADPG